MKAKFVIMVGGGLALLAVYVLVGRRSAFEPAPNTDKQILPNSFQSVASESPEPLRREKQRVSHPLAVVPPLHFDTPLNTETEKQLFLDEAKKRPTSELLSVWKQQLSETNYAHLDFVEIAMANKIKDNPDSDEAKEIYGYATGAFDRGELNETEMVRLLKVLGQSGGTSVVQLFLRWFDQTDNKDFQREILSQLTSTSERAAYGQNAESVSHILETRWQEAVVPSDFDSGLLPVLGVALAKTGSPGGVGILLKEIANGGSTRQQFETESDAKARLALQSIIHVRSEASVDLLAQSMRQGSPEDMKFLASGEALASISKPASTKVLIDWAQRADEAYAPLVEDWLSQLRDYDSRKMVRYLFIENVTFHSEQVKQAVAKAIRSYD